ncbi:MAG: GNAT family N-acetyltransferase [Alphaproteobacteria bacterium]|nr:GNAT family N-acetyltransferase [Alphaproteobacteria bacterium]
MPSLVTRHSLSSLPSWAQAELAPTRAIDPFFSATWFEVFLESCPEPGVEPLFLAIDAGARRGVAALRERRGAGRQLGDLGNFYTCRYAPVLGAVDRELAAGLAAWLSEERPRIDTLRFDNLRAEDDPQDAVAAALRARGFAVQRYEQFGNWFEDVRGIGFAQYLAARDGQLRSTIERKGRRFARQAGARLELMTAASDLERGLAAYLEVHARSWKEPEPFPGFIPAFVRRFGAVGAVRMGVAWVDERPLAAQIWLAWGRHATIAKLVYDDAAKALSPGTVLTARMLEDALDAKLFDEIDLGRGDDPYKKLWLRDRRPVHGLFAANLRSPRGLAAAARNFGPTALKAIAARFRTIARPS